MTWRKLAETFQHMHVSDPGPYQKGFTSGSNGARPQWRFGRMWKVLQEIRARWRVEVRKIFVV